MLSPSFTCRSPSGSWAFSSSVTWTEDTRPLWPWSAGRRSHQASDVPYGHRPRQPLERQGADILGLDQRFRRRRHPAGHEDLARTGLAAQPRRQIRDGADRAVIHASLEADGADRRIALRDADPERQIPAALAPSLGKPRHHVAHGDGHADGPLRGILDLDRIVEEDHHAVTGEAL